MKEYSLYIHHLLKEDLYYVGITTNKRSRFNPSAYRHTAFEKYAYPSIIHNANIETVCTEPLYTYDEAKFIEDWFITAFKPGKCINKIRSGQITMCKGYHKMKYQENPEKGREKSKKWRDNNLERAKEITKNSHHKLYSTVEWKIYSRVANYNKNHPDQKKETPLEAKQRYITEGYIPDYIKSSDLQVRP